MQPTIVQLRHIADSRGTVTFIESERDIPFVVKRAYWLDNLSPEQARGFHAHQNLRQVAFCLRGNCEMALDNGHERQTILLDTPTRGVLIDKMIWHEMRFMDNALLLTFASDYYDEADYIRSYDIFLEIITRKNQ
ncbi:FdtA/QdtA family cupin domain-containing protein [Candidatus Persebacteraceae bacterium Df01]|jgi:hypothetical protein|uniref:FdtA/QdtA family cupin domain-containing protein n=1 Tax=Candidatus Doriopsillibacter californiensis TaxID=2970740 RepID=A0ABT7QNZ3_9GAMM|nr:FdtA/QdtA family cupin domain-containing protein [Candidatus Persebacteraceae bacterium Df01]